MTSSRDFDPIEIEGEEYIEKIQKKINISKQAIYEIINKEQDTIEDNIKVDWWMKNKWNYNKLLVLRKLLQDEVYAALMKLKYE